MNRGCTGILALALSLATSPAMAQFPWLPKLFGPRDSAPAPLPPLEPLPPPPAIGPQERDSTETATADSAELAAPATRPVEPLYQVRQAATSGAPEPQASPPERLPAPAAEPSEGPSAGESESRGGEATWVLDELAVTEPLPLEDPATGWWSYPWLWIPREGWKNQIHLGLNGTEGNSRTTSLQSGAQLRWKDKLNRFSTDLDYRVTHAGGVQTQDNGRLNVDYDRMVGETPWAWFTKVGVEYDQFKAFDLRVNANTGLGYYWLRDEQTTLVTRFGSGASQSIGAPDDRWKAEAVLGIEAERQLNPRHKLKAKVDYFPQWNNFDHFRAVADASWEMLLDEANNLSLKLGASDRYDSTPQGRRPNDLFYSAMLLWKF